MFDVTDAIMLIFHTPNHVKTYFNYQLKVSVLLNRPYFVLKGDVYILYLWLFQKTV